MPVKWYCTRELQRIVPHTPTSTLILRTKQQEGRQTKRFPTKLYIRKVESCCVTEARLVSEFRRNPYARAILVTTMARFRTDRREQAALFKEAVDLLRSVP